MKGIILNYLNKKLWYNTMMQILKMSMLELKQLKSEIVACLNNIYEYPLHDWKLRGKLKALINTINDLERNDWLTKYAN
jgi:hypothetical protein